MRTTIYRKLSTLISIVMMENRILYFNTRMNIIKLRYSSKSKICERQTEENSAMIRSQHISFQLQDITSLFRFLQMSCVSFNEDATNRLKSKNIKKKIPLGSVLKIKK